jgi:hypothetical protein
MENYNKIQSFITSYESTQFKKIFLKNTPTSTEYSDKCYGIDINNTKSYLWFRKTLLPRINKFFDVELKLIFAFYSSFTKPFIIHKDLKPIPNNLKGRPFVSCLIPVSVDNDINRCHLASTIIFKTGKNVNAELDQKNYLSHCQLDTLKNKKINKIFSWSSNDMIWWRSELDHCSGYFSNFKSKECFVIHTYVE